jgi:defect-in-organelle-trafficking protein DotB
MMPATAADPSGWNIDTAFFTKEDLDNLLRWAVDTNVSDITLQSNQAIYCDRYGKISTASPRRMKHAEMEKLVRDTISNDAVSRINQGKDIDTAIVIPVDRDTNYRFRLNATGGAEGSQNIIQITLRSIPRDPPNLASLALEPEILNQFYPKQGLVVVGGPTGSGKTTLLAAMMRASAVELKHSFKLNTYESPIEFDLTKYCSQFCIIHQVQVETHLASFAAGTRNSMRRAPKRILIGEARDAETMAGVIECSNTGHATYTTTHASNVQGSVRRLVSAFSGEDKTLRVVELIDNMHMIVNQILVPTVDGKRTPLREYLVFDGGIRQTLLETPVDRLPAIAASLVRKHGQTMLDAARKALAAGLIEQRIVDQYELVYKTREDSLVA